jgi:hypothetical protein
MNELTKQKLFRFLLHMINFKPWSQTYRQTPITIKSSISCIYILTLKMKKKLYGFDVTGIRRVVHVPPSGDVDCVMLC